MKDDQFNHLRHADDLVIVSPIIIRWTESTLKKNFHYSDYVAMYMICVER